MLLTVMASISACAKTDVQKDKTIEGLRQEVAELKQNQDQLAARLSSLEARGLQSTARGDASTLPVVKLVPEGGAPSASTEPEPEPQRSRVSQPNASETEARLLISGSGADLKATEVKGGGQKAGSP